MAGPVARPISPLADAEDVNPAASIRLLLWGDPIEPWTIEVDRGSGLELALTFDAGEAVFESEFNGEFSAVDLDGGVYSIVVDPRENFPLASSPIVDITAEDSLGNPVVIG